MLMKNVNVSSLQLKNKKVMFVFLLIILIRIIYYFNVDLTIAHDTNGYVYFNWNAFLSGNMQPRTPIYPLIITFFKIFSTQYFLQLVAIFQIFVSFLSLVFLYKILNLLNKNKFINLILIFIYGVNPTIMSWDMCILTESISLSLTIFLFYYVILYLYVPKFKLGLICSCIIFIMIFLRPTFLLFYVFFIILLILKIIFSKNKKIFYKNLSTASIILVILLGYAYQFKQEYGIFSISDAMPRQQLYIYLEKEFYKYEKSDSFINDCYNIMETKDKSLWEKTFILLDKYGNSYISDRTNNFKKENLSIFLKDYTYTVTVHWKNSFMPYINIESIHTNFVYSLFNFSYNFTFGNIILLSILGSVIGIYKWIKNKKIDFLFLGIPTLILCIIFTTFYATNASYDRTAIYCLPIFMILTALFFSEINKLTPKHKI